MAKENQQIYFWAFYVFARTYGARKKIETARYSTQSWIFLVNLFKNASHILIQWNYTKYTQELNNIFKVIANVYIVRQIDIVAYGVTKPN